jgi:hypothetical protein
MPIHQGLYDGLGSKLRSQSSDLVWLSFENDKPPRQRILRIVVGLDFCLIAKHVQSCRN